MRSILLSIKPKWAAKILNGEKTIEIRKTYPKCDLPIDVYIYCTKDNKIFLRDYRDKKKWAVYWRFVAMEKDPSIVGEEPPILNGKVVAKFTLKKIEEIKIHHLCFIVNEKEITEKSCLTKEELNEYLNVIKLNPKTKELYCGYAWHIDNLQIFDKPKSLTWIRGTKQGIDFVGKPYYKFLKRPPQSYCYIEL